MVEDALEVEEEGEECRGKDPEAARSERDLEIDGLELVAGELFFAFRAQRQRTVRWRLTDEKECGGKKDQQGHGGHCQQAAAPARSRRHVDEELGEEEAAQIRAGIGHAQREPPASARPATHHMPDGHVPHAGRRQAYPRDRDVEPDRALYAGEVEKDRREERRAEGQYARGPEPDGEIADQWAGQGLGEELWNAGGGEGGSREAELLDHEGREGSAHIGDAEPHLADQAAQHHPERPTAKLAEHPGERTEAIRRKRRLHGRAPYSIRAGRGRVEAVC